jgi:hypothetical protein
MFFRLEFCMRGGSWTSHPGTADWFRSLVVGFVSGAGAVVVFHQGAAAVLHAMDLTARIPYSLEPTRPFGVPQLWSLAFWGGIWGIALAATLARLEGVGLVLASTSLGAVLPTMIAWFVVAPLKGQPIAAGAVPPAMAVGVALNALWGLGTGLGLASYERWRRRTLALQGQNS